MKKTSGLLRSITILVLLFLFAGVVMVQASPDAIGQGVCAKVVNSNSSGGLAVRVHPSTSATLIRRMPDNTVVRITGGPISFGGYTWWAHDNGGGRNNAGWSASNWLQEVSCGSKPAYTVANQLSQEVQLYTGSWVQASTLTGGTYAKWMNSYYGRPGQFPLAAPVTSKSGMRSSSLYKAVIHQFAVGTNPRYTANVPSAGYTYCNTFAGDVMRAMGVPLPVKSGSDPATVGTSYLYNNYNWSANGWIQVNPRNSSGTNSMTTLISYVNAGKPAVAVTSGHIAVIRPQSTPSDYTYLYLAQAGAQNSNSILLRSVWSSSSWSSIKFFVHN